MSAGRRAARRQAVFALYRQDLLKLDADRIMDSAMQGGLDDYAVRLVAGVTSNISVLDGLLGENLSGWRLERLGILERAILRVAAYELAMEKDVPVAVVVDEAVNLAKRFCSVEAGALVNGILGNVAVEARSPEVMARADDERSL